MMEDKGDNDTEESGESDAWKDEGDNESELVSGESDDWHGKLWDAIAGGSVINIMLPTVHVYTSSN